MARSRLTEIQKQSLVKEYRNGKSASSLAKEFSCSTNTVTRTVKAFMTNEEYTALKLTRSKPDSIISTEATNEPTSQHADSLVPLEDLPEENTSGEREQIDSIDLEDKASGPLALDDADDFGDDTEEGAGDDELPEPSVNSSSFELFQEVVPLTTAFNFQDQRDLPCESLPLKSASLPESVYMLVDKTVELESKPLRDFPELGLIPEVDQERQAIYLFANQRSAKRNCGRGQRVIKIPDTSVFELTSSFLLARGITRLIIEGSLISLD